MPLKCDFCSSLNVKWSYPARTFDLPEIRSTSLGAWAACPVCYELIERNDRTGLLLRSVETCPNPMPSSLTVTFMRRIHDGFWGNRQGAPVRID